MSVTALPPLPQGRPVEPVLLRFGDQWKLTLLHFDLAVITLWFYVTTVQFRYDELLLYPMALYFTFAFFRDRHMTWPVLQRGFILLLVPIWWMTSALWSPEPALAFRSGLQSLLTILICMFMASRLDTRLLLSMLLIALAVFAFWSLPVGLVGLSYGTPIKAMYPHKNAFGIDMSVLWVSALALLLSPGVPKLVRVTAMATMPIALLLVFASQSATAILLSFGMAGVLIGALVYLGRKNTLTFGRIALLSLTVSFLLGVIVAWTNLASTDPITLVLNALGKDRGLTGRTDLWAIAMAEIAERPLLGTGAKGYWRYDDTPFIRQIFIDYYKERGNNFHFHNSWLELSVNIGIVGAFLAAIATLWALGVLLWRAVSIGNPLNWALLAVGLAVFARTMTEAALFSAFVKLDMILWTGALILPSATGGARRFGEVGRIDVHSPPILLKKQCVAAQHGARKARLNARLHRGR
ncbi:MAG: O-antigen ligase family protein [Pseudomonadota bacterium]